MFVGQKGKDRKRNEENTTIRKMCATDYDNQPKVPRLAETTQFQESRHPQSTERRCAKIADGGSEMTNSEKKCTQA